MKRLRRRPGAVRSPLLYSLDTINHAHKRWRGGFALDMENAEGFLRHPKTATTMIDQARKLALIHHIKQRQLSNQGEILLEPDLYFDGYDEDQCGICANGGSISTARFAARLRAIRQRSDVAGMFIRFYNYDDALESEDAWIGSDTVYVVTSDSLESVRDAFSDLGPSDVWEEANLAAFPDVSNIPVGFRLIAVWRD